MSLAARAERVALVIGNNAYANLPSQMQLQSPVSDAADVAAALKKLGYRIIGDKPLTNGTREAMTGAAEAFAAAAKSAEAAVFYYSGHGIQVGEDNYLLPTDTPKLTALSMLKNRCILLRDTIMVGLEEAGAGNKVIILDCCRDNPFSAQLDAALAQVGKSVKTKSVGEMSGYGAGFYLAFATSPGSTALDGNGNRNSPFTGAMLKVLETKSGEDIDFFFREVKKSLPRDQVSWTNHSLQSGFALGLVRPVEEGALMAERERLEKARLALEEERKRLEMAKLTPPKTAVPPPAVDPDAGPAKAETGAVGKTLEVGLPGGKVMRFCYCPPGKFTMGSPVGEPGHQADENQVSVTISQGFWMAETEVTQVQWQSVMGTNPSKFKGASLPVERVSWEDTQEMVRKLNQTARPPSGFNFALPTEAQWEYACRAGTQTAYAFGSQLTPQEANFGKGADGQTVSVKTYRPNRWGLYDMHGNVWEWCSDLLGYRLQGGVDPRGASSGVYRVDRGGSWSSDAVSCRAASRSGLGPGDRLNILGFRPALVPSR